MKRAHVGRGLRATLTVLAVGLLATAVSAAAGVSAHATAHHSSLAPNACVSKVGGPARVGHFSGIVRAVPVKAGCVHNTSDAANGTPPLIWHDGPVMGTPSTGPVVVTPIFWSPAGHPMAGSYKNIITTYLADVAAASGHNSNVYSTLTEYFGSNGAINYQIKLGAPINDTGPLPADGCTLNAKDTRAIYADNSGYDACLDDDQVIAETDSIVAAHHLTRDYAHIYVMYLPKRVESCFFAGSTATRNNFCTINHQLSAAYCAYHNQAPSSTVYANMPFPIYGSPVGFTCGSDASFPAIETPNGNPDADTEISPSSHEIMEAITDPDTTTGWFDSSGFENGDECAYVFGPTKGTPGTLYNQVINHHKYLTQEEFSNNDFARTGLGCLQSG
ncbi:MAG: hypothetical protein QOG02_32 [Gaiellales bacterium]|nr:hypothetical protein [Gaiellales bacterium]